MGRGIIKIDLLVLKDALLLPEEYITIGTFSNDRGDDISIIVDHPDIPEVEASEPFPLIMPIYEAKYIRTNEFKEVRIEHKVTTEPVEETMARLGIRRREHGTDRA